MLFFNGVYDLFLKQYDDLSLASHMFSFHVRMQSRMSSSIFSPVCDPNVLKKLSRNLLFSFAYSPMISARNLQNFLPCSGFVM